MSCGNPHDTDCAEVLDKVYAYLDNEIDDTSRTKIRQHLDECGPCLEKYGLDQVVKALVHRHCGGDAAPEDLRGKVMWRIRQVQVEIRSD